MSTDISLNSRNRSGRKMTDYRSLIRISLLWVLFSVAGLNAAEPPTLMTLVMKWRYPEAKFQGAMLSDGATVGARGERTVPSTVWQCEYLTDDSVADVVAFYKEFISTLKPGPEIESLQVAGGRSVHVLDGGKDRDLGMQIILINETNASTTLVISRAKQESQTHIAWSRYERL